MNEPITENPSLAFALVVGVLPIAVLVGLLVLLVLHFTVGLT